MDYLSDLPTELPGGQVLVLEAAAGPLRRERLEAWLAQARASGATTWLLDCDARLHGPWAGVAGWLQALLPDLQADAPELVVRHDFELVTVLPALRRTLTVRNPNLTDTATAQERVRNYAADRAVRIVHGLIDLLAAWHRQRNDGPWVVACDGYDQAGVLAQRFFTELMRRRGRRLNLTLLVAVAPGAGETAGAGFAPGSLAGCVRLELPPAAPPAPAELARLAAELEAQVGSDLLEIEMHAPRLSHYWLQAGQPARALPWLARACSIITHQGLYADAIPYGEAALPLYAETGAADEAKRWQLAYKLINCYLAVGRTDDAHQLLTATTAATTDPTLKFHNSYMMAMLHARYLPQTNQELAEAWLERGLAEVAESGLPEKQRWFHSVFLRNGLALVRQRQGRPADAIALCREGSAALDAHLDPHEHRLHRSVLLYNIAQVHSVVGNHAEAETHFSAAMAMDPNYSEYYNERGNLYLRMGQPELALRDYLQAIELSPPYAEVWGNLGACYRVLGRPQAAVDAYTTCLDLYEADVWALVYRAMTYAELGQPAAALADYTAALALDPEQRVALGNRAVLLYEAGRVLDAVLDLDGAIAAAPGEAELYYNRATALADLGRCAEAAADLREYLALTPDAEDRAEVEAQLTALAARTVDA